MKRGGKIALNIVIILVCVALFAGAISYWALNKTSAANRLRSKAKNEYFDREFLMAYNTYHELIDSLKVSDDAASMNYANSAFMSSKALKNGLYGSTRGRVGGVDAEVQDETKDSLFDFSQAEYVRLSSAKNNKVASVAYNQMGYSTLRVNKDFFASTNPDSSINVALDHFKNALRRNPENDSARYNYELLKRLSEFPDDVMKQTQDLVNQKRYREAANVLENGMRISPSLKKQQEYLTRLKQIVKIDSLYARTR